MMNDWDFPKMSELGVTCAGHEGSGVIVKVGKDVNRYRAGQRAAIGPTYSVCGSCGLCRSEYLQYCPEAVYTGLTHNGECNEDCVIDKTYQALGSYQQYCSISEDYVIVSHTE
jgi:D-arabinose 1-dehydrogenase-like Zn-dependent alcohol dehydrogenase